MFSFCFLPLPFTLSHETHLAWKPTSAKNVVVHQQPDQFLARVVSKGLCKPLPKHLSFHSKLETAFNKRKAYVFHLCLNHISESRCWYCSAEDYAGVNRAVAIPAFPDIPIHMARMTVEQVGQRFVLKMLNSVCQPTNALLQRSWQSLGTADS